MELINNWKVLQDVDFLGESCGIEKFGFQPSQWCVCAIEPWQPIRIGYLQPQLADNPYYGRALRQFNEAPWWYCNEFVWEDDAPGATLTFHGVDYYADVWFNEQYLGFHEGAGSPFSFEVGGIIRRGEPNRLVVKVSSPWDHEVMDGQYNISFIAAVRKMLKGSYEHNDSFIPRDINPLGIWNTVTVTAHQGAVLSELFADSRVTGDLSSATVTVSALLGAEDAVQYEAVSRLYDEGGVLCAEESTAVSAGAFSQTLTVAQPKLWTVWERGTPHRYHLQVTVSRGGKTLLTENRMIGLRRLDFVRTAGEFSVSLNGEKLYLRGATYFPTFYISEQNREQYRHDLETCMRDGMNALRVHVHTEKDDFYDLCDEMGILLIQDTDFNWVHPLGEEFADKAVAACREMLVHLRNHPSIFSWVMLNEARHSDYFTLRPGPQMMALGAEMGGGRLCIQNSWDAADWINSGDSHNYDGSLAGNGSHYLNIFGQKEKLNTEFGMDGIPARSSMLTQPELCRRLDGMIDEIGVTQEYQYRYIKYFTEHYRLQKFAPCSGHFHFLWSDPAPTSWFGAYDWLRHPKKARRAYAESNQPLAVLMELTADGKDATALWVVNDTLDRYEGSTLHWLVTDDGGVVSQGSTAVDVEKNSIVRAADFVRNADWSADVTVELYLCDRDGNHIAANRYEAAFAPPPHPAGHPENIDFGIGMHLYGAKK